MSSYLSDFMSRMRGTAGAEASSADQVQEDAPAGWGKGSGGSESVPWIGISSKKGPTQIVCNPKAAQVLLHVAESPLNLVSIFGAARQGKSFLMNMLAGEEGVFRISNSKDPCTQGVDISRKMLAWTAFQRLDDQNAGGGGQTRVARASSEPAPRIAFVDCEGQGDRDATYDANLICPILLASKVAIFNWKDSLQRDRLLNLLAVMQRAAYNVSPEEEEDAEGGSDDHQGGSSKIFGHLHIVFRDWTYEGDVQSVYKTLFTPERVASPDATARNELRRVLEASFESISVWLLPPPVERTSELSKALSPKDLSPDFKLQIRKLRSALAEQLKSPHHFHGKVLTGAKIAGLVPFVAKELNSGKTVLPKSAYMSLIEAEVARAQLTFLTRLQQVLESVKAEAQKVPIASSKLRVKLQGEVHTLQGERSDSGSIHNHRIRGWVDRLVMTDFLLMMDVQREFDKWAASLGDPAMQQESTNIFNEQCTKAVEEVLLFNRQHYISAHLMRAAMKAKELFDETFTKTIHSRLPLSPEALVLEGQKARAAAEAMVKEVVVGEAEVEDLLHDALEVVTGHAELQMAKVEAVNKAKLNEVQKQEVQVYGDAKAKFLSSFYDHLATLKAKGPIVERDFVGAYQKSLAEGKAHFTTALGKSGITNAERKAELIRFLEEAAEVVKGEQGALYQLRCTQDVIVETLSAIHTLFEKTRSLSDQSAGDLKASYHRIEKEVSQQLKQKLAKASGAPEDTVNVCLQALGTFANGEYEAAVARGQSSSTSEAELHKLQALVKEKNNEVKAKEAALQAKQAELATKANELKLGVARLAEKDVEVQDMNKEIISLETQLRDKTQEIADMAEKVKALEEARHEEDEDEVAASKPSARKQAAGKRKLERAEDEADEEDSAVAMDTGDEPEEETAAPVGKGTPAARKGKSQRTSTPTQQSAAQGGGGSGSKLDQARLEERKRIEEETKKRVTRGKK